MRVLHRWTVGKEALDTPLNEDASICFPAKGIYAVSDGASESFASRRWSRILVSMFVRQPNINEAWLTQSIALYDQMFDRSAMSWSAQGSFDRGSFATLLGLRLDRDRRGVSLVGIGDSLVVLDDGDRIVSTYPYTDAEQFRHNPLLLSTIQDRNSAIWEADFCAHWRFADIASPRLFCMTDAIGAWLLSDREERITDLRRLQSHSDFIELVEAARAKGLMRQDDTTLLVIG